MTQPSSKYFVLYADDDMDDLDLVKEAFLEFTTNVEVITAQNGIEALSYLKNLNPGEPEPCLIILDINMPLLNGKETLKEIRKIERFEDTSVVLFTTSSLPFDKVFAERHKAGYITKPITEKQLSVIAQEFLDHCSESVIKNIRPK